MPLLLGVMLLTFALLRGAAASPFRLETGGIPLPLQERFTRFYGLDRPWFVEFWRYVRNVVTFQVGPTLTNRWVTAR